MSLPPVAAGVVARTQALLTVGALLALLLWLLYWLQQGQPGWALAGAVVVLGGHAGVLAVEFAWLRRSRSVDGAQAGGPPTPVDGRTLLRAWWRETLAAPRVFCWRQPFRSRRWPDRLPQGAPDPAVSDPASSRRGVLFIHGFLCNRGIWNPWLRALTQRDQPFVALNLEPVFGSIDAYVPRIEMAVQQLQRATGLAPVVVAHSMGGLALRAWWAASGSDARIHHAITLGSPHGGTDLAQLAWLGENTRQMRRHSTWLQALAATEAPARLGRVTCFYSDCDNIVFPPLTATLPGADNRHIPGVPHVHLVDHPEPWSELLRRLASP